MSEPIRVFIGFDEKEAVAYSVLANSIRQHASVPVSVTPISLNNLKHCYWRPRDVKQSTDFSFSRFLTPFLAGYKGWAIWMDCDMLCRSDIIELYNLRNDMCSVMVVKHDYTPTTETKFLGNTQYAYPKKNWSSVMLFNCGHFHSRTLTPEYVNKATGAELHQFQWTEENRIGDIPREWNHLVGEYPYNPTAKLVHFTIGGPYFHEYENCDYSQEWFEAYRSTMRADQLFIPRLKVSSR